MVAAYERLLDAQTQLADARARHGLSEAAIAEALAASDPDGGAGADAEDLYLASLTRLVAALGGRLEVQAVFAEETVTVFRAGADAGGCGPAHRGPPADRRR